MGQDHPMAVELYAYTCGYITLPSAFLLTKTRGWLTVPVPAYLVVHSKGRVLFDSGMNTITQTDPVAYLGVEGAKANQVAFKPGEEIGARLRAMAIDPASITHVVNSHLHYDHCGGNAQLPNADVVVQADEWSHAVAQPDDDVAYHRTDFDTGQRVRRIAGEHDIFGDGTVTCVPTPGHTPGHQSLRVKTPRGDFVLCGDACYLRQSLEQMHLPGILHDREKALNSLRWFQKMQDEHHRLMFGHDPEFWTGVPQAPARLA
jgi:N-acyl homoserine lactone hydrolase